MIETSRKSGSGTEYVTLLGGTSASVFRAASNPTHFDLKYRQDICKITHYNNPGTI
jgi:hypothetical protein